MCSSYIDYLCRRMTELEGVRLLSDFAPRNRSQINYFRLDERLKVTQEKLLRLGVRCPVTEEPGAAILRTGVHYYNSFADADRLADAVKACKSI